MSRRAIGADSCSNEAFCMECTLPFFGNTLLTRWDGAIVCTRCWDPRPRTVIDPWPRRELPPKYILPNPTARPDPASSTDYPVDPADAGLGEPSS